MRVISNFFSGIVFGILIGFVTAPVIVGLMPSRAEASTSVSVPESPDETFIKEETSCLAANIYFEARGEGTVGQVAVARVTINRTLREGFPSTICGVVTAGIKDASGKQKKHRCAFSWYCDGLPDVVSDPVLYRKIYRMAESFVRGHRDDELDITEGATHFHTVAVNPAWKHELRRVARIGDHLFYR